MIEGALFCGFVVFLALATTTRPEVRYALTRVLVSGLIAGACLAVLVERVS